MGGGETIVDAIRKWFLRTFSSTSSVSSSVTPSGSNSNDTQLRQRKDRDQDDWNIEFDIDLSGLRVIKVPKRAIFFGSSPYSAMDHHKKNNLEYEFFTEYGEASRYQVQEVIGKGSYGVVASAIDTHTGEKVAIKKINNVFEHVSDSIRILRESFSDYYITQIL